MIYSICVAAHKIAINPIRSAKDSQNEVFFPEFPSFYGARLKFCETTFCCDPQNDPSLHVHWLCGGPVGDKFFAVFSEHALIFGGRRLFKTLSRRIFCQHLN